jgi:RNA polymerase sigma-70 factor (ECF subfamily)
MNPKQATRRFYAVIWPHRAHVLRLAKLLVRDAAEAEDLAQETLMRAYRNIERLDARGNVRGWLSRVLRNVRIDQARLRGVNLLRDAHPLDPAQIAAPADTKAVDPDERSVAELIESFSDQAIIDALRTLPEEICWTLLLLDVQQLSLEEAADIMTVPLGTVKSRAHRGRRMLRDILAGRNAPPVARSFVVEGSHEQA